MGYGWELSENVAVCTLRRMVLAQSGRPCVRQDGLDAAPYGYGILFIVLRFRCGGWPVRNGLFSDCDVLWTFALRCAAGVPDRRS